MNPVGMESARQGDRRALRVRGLVQGVGFRPFVWRLANELALAGSVRNDGAGVAIEVQGPCASLDRFEARLTAEAPASARIECIVSVALEPGVRQGFAIEASTCGTVHTGVGPDLAVCDACVDELLDPRARRYRYPFTHCTHCGPRYSMTRALPFDRANTSMARFPLCPACRDEYGAPAHRRFHAQATACPACGPRLRCLDTAGRAIDTVDPIAYALARLRDGAILAVKGVGGYHLMCDATAAAVVARLRRRKQREEKPFAVLMASAASAAGVARVDAASRALLEDPARPIVLLDKRDGCDARLPGVAPGVGTLGVMLPYTPLHVLLFHEAAGRPGGTDWLREPQGLALVATSANPGGEPLLTGDDEALERLAGIADGFLVHDREIVVRCDDSLVRASGHGATVVRRGRGVTPHAIELAGDGPAVLATGAYLKNAVCVTRGAQAFLSQHVGDLDSAASRRALEDAAAHLLDLLGIRPARIAHDLHPDAPATAFATRIADALGVPCVAVQHHHAHIAAVAAEHRVRGPLLGLALDGVGLGADGSAWGGELLQIDGAAMTRLGHLHRLALPGGDRAAREPWRMAASLLHELGQGGDIARRFATPAAAVVAQMLEREVRTPRTSSAGRWFDAAAGLLGVRAVCAFEGQAAMMLEDLAQRHGAAPPLERGWSIGPDGVLDLRPLGAWLAVARDAGVGAAVFHATLACALADWVRAAASASQLSCVALGGGCFVNRVLTDALRARLESAGLEVIEARDAPVNDGGLALGQAWVARAAA